MRQWAVDAVAQAVDDGVLSVERVVINDEVAESLDGDRLATLRRYVDTARDYGPWAVVSAYHNVLDTPDHLRWVPLDDLPWADAERVPCTPEPAESFGQVLPEDVVDDIAADTDVVLRFGFGIIKGDVLTEPKYGVLSFHHGDLRRYRGRPVGAWEFLEGADQAGVTLQRLTETLDGGAVVKLWTTDISDADTWREVERRLFAVSTGMLSAGLASLRAGEEPTTLPSDDLGALYTDPDARETARFLAKNAVGSVRGLLGR
nr:formyltransferase family protein [Halomarina rubra]